MSLVTSQLMIRLRGVRHNNLKNLDLDLPQRQLIVFTGLSGSGKSSLAFDTLFAEGQRRYIETFSPYARQFFDRMDKPQADSIEGIPPAIAIEQRNSVRTTRSTVGTMTELCDYMKVLWPRLTQLHCRQCNQVVRQEPPLRIWESFSREHHDADLIVTFDVPLVDKLSLEESIDLIGRQGYRRLLIGQELVRIEDALAALRGRRPAAFTVVQDRLRAAPSNRQRFVEACEQAYHFGHGTLWVRIIGCPGGGAWPFSMRRHCAVCDIDYREPTPALFSFNHPLGACPVCHGFGRTITIDYGRALPDRGRTLAQGAVKPWRSGLGAECQQDLLKFCRVRGVPVNIPFRELSREHQRWIVDGDPDYGTDDSHQWPHAWYGVKGYFRWLESKAYKMHVRVLLSRYRGYKTCPACGGQRLQPDALLYRLPLSSATLLESLDDKRLAMHCGREPGGRTRPPGVPACSVAEHDSGWTGRPLSHDCAAGTSSPTPRFVGSAKAQGDGREASDWCSDGSGDATEFGGLNLAGFYKLPIRECRRCIERLAARHAPSLGDPIGIALAEVKARIDYLIEAGLGYLTLDRPTRTLSGGEIERVNLTACLGTRLVNTLFVLDEPTVGLHPRDTARLVALMHRLRDSGNTVVVVEHECAVIRAADHVVDLGPGSGERGGHVVFQGTFENMIDCAESLTGQYLGGRRTIGVTNRRPVRPSRPTDHGPSRPAVSYSGPAGVPASGVLADALPGLPGGADSLSPTAGVSEVSWLVISHAHRFNIADLTVSIPLARLVCVTGVSGSGKTTLVKEVLLPALEHRLRMGPALSQPDTDQEEDDRETEERSDDTAIADIRGWERLSGVVLVDQSPIGRTPRSNPAVYVGAFDEIRELYAQSEQALQRGLVSSSFSFNSVRGQCERCRGAGFEKIEMQFLSDVFVRCPDCDGRRYKQLTLEVEIAPQVGLGSTRGAVRSKNIADLLESTVDQAVEFLELFPEARSAIRAARRLRLLQEVGLGYMRLGQPINTLSGGECQRLKLAGHLVTSIAGDRPAQSIRTAAMAQQALAALLRRKRSADPTAQPRGSTLFLFDEPTTGLHFDDIRVLLEVFQGLVKEGHSVVIIEHNLDVIRCADWIIDLGPEAGDEGGRIVVEGTPEDVAACEQSHTGRALKLSVGEV